MGVRLRALLLLLVLTASDYLLWNWSIADSHDILSLVAGLTLLPLAAMSLGGLALMGARLIAWLLGRPASARASKGSSKADASSNTQYSTAAEPDSPSRLAA